MKKLCSLVVLVLFPFFLRATVYTVCNMAYCQPAPGILFTTFSDAHDAATDGDIIYIQGSSINYGSIYIYKRLTIIGAGHHPNKQNPLTSSFIDIEVSATGVKLMGLTFNKISTYGYANGVVKKCRILGTSGYIPISLSNTSGWLIEGNIVSSMENYYPCVSIYSSSNNLIIQNNIFSSPGPKISGIQNSSSDRSYILNNIFLGTGYYTILESMRYTNIENNLFIGGYNPDSGMQNCVMNNNISYACTDNSFQTSGINNMVNVDPQFINYPGSPVLFDYAYDFSLATTSPGHNTGTDGTDRGVFGGIGFKFTTTGEPAISEVTALTITSGTTVAPGGSITISLTSKSVH